MNLTNTIAENIASFSADSISNAFIILTLVLFASSTVVLIKGMFTRFTDSVPTLLTSLGILGTFAGIVVGLMAFDPQNIDGSIHSLLAGLKTAFLTSLVGMTSSIVFGLISNCRTENDSEDNPDIGPEAIYSVMSAHLKVSQELLASIKGEEDASLTSQIKNLRADLSDGNRNLSSHFKESAAHSEQFQDKLWQQMDKFGDLLSKSATEQVINALKEVIVEFNDKLTEQFGENFKRLDDSVKNLVEWQDNYREQLSDMTNQYKLGVEAIDATSQSVASISDRTLAIPSTMEKLEQVMNISHGQVTDLESRLEAFQSLRDNAINAMPVIKEQLDTTMDTIRDSVKNASSHYEIMLSDSQEVIGRFGQAAENSATTVQETSKLLKSANQDLKQHSQDLQSTTSDAIIKLQDRLETTLESVFNAQAQAVTRTFDSLEGQITDAVGRTGRSVEQQVDILDEKMQQEINQTISVMGEALATVTQQFTRDYQKLVREMKTVVNSGVMA